MTETLRLAESKMLDGLSRTWMVGSLEDLSEITGDCCGNMRVRRECYTGVDKVVRSSTAIF